MSLILKPTALDKASSKAARAADHLATTLRDGWNQVWNRDPAIVADELNADLAKSTAIFALNTQASTAINALLDALDDDRYANRAPTEMPDGWELTEQGFVYTPPEPEVEPEP